MTCQIESSHGHETEGVYHVIFQSKVHKCLFSLAVDLNFSYLHAPITSGHLAVSQVSALLGYLSVKYRQLLTFE